MKTEIRNRLAAILCCSFLLAAEVSLARGEQTEQFDFQPGQLLQFDLKTGGSIAIEGWDRSVIEVSYRDRSRNLADYDIAINSTDSGLSVAAELIERDGNSSLSFKVKAPRELLLDFYTAGGGIELTGLVGEFSGKTAGGALMLDDVTGQVDLKTGGGQIKVLDSYVDGKVRTGGGKVLVQNVVGDLSASSGGGDVLYKNVRSIDGDLLGPKRLDMTDATEDTVLISNAGGRINLKQAPAGVSVYTGGGGISIAGAQRFVAAKTGGGEIDIEVIQGWVKAQTGAGEIQVTIKQNPEDQGDISLISGNGNIILTLPEDFSMDLDVELGVTNNAKRDYTIHSDFDIEVETSDNWDYSKGSPRKFVYGTASIGGGDNQIKIRTTNGNVEIRRSNNN